MPTTRPARIPDAPRITELLAELGYAADLAVVESRVASALASRTDAVLVAEVGGVVAGVASLHAFDLLRGPRNAAARLGSVRCGPLAAGPARTGDRRARPLERVFDIDLQRCPSCSAGGRAEDHRGDPAAGGDREDPHPPGVGSPAAAPGTGERGGARVRRRLRSARHPGHAPWAGAAALQPGWRWAPCPASGPSPGSRPGSRPAAARIPAAFTPGCVQGVSESPPSAALPAAASRCASRRSCRWGMSPPRPVPRRPTRGSATTSPPRSGTA